MKIKIVGELLTIISILFLLASILTIISLYVLPTSHLMKGGFLSIFVLISAIFFSILIIYITRKKDIFPH